MFITFSFRIIVLSIGYYASLGGEDTSQAKDFGIGGVTSWLDGGLDSFANPTDESINLRLARNSLLIVYSGGWHCPV
jgi:hypothetical protein